MMGMLIGGIFSTMTVLISMYVNRHKTAREADDLASQTLQRAWEHIKQLEERVAWLEKEVRHKQRYENILKHALEEADIPIPPPPPDSETKIK